MTSIALVTTTIRVPTVLEWYRAMAPDVAIYVIGDRQTPHREVADFVSRLGNARYYSDEDQAALGYACSEVIGWRHPGRRSIGLLEAARHGADVIVTVDDDNIPLRREYFPTFTSILCRPFDGLAVRSADGWVDAGEFLLPQVHHRGFPHELWHRSQPATMGHAVAARVGVAAGLWIGDPDVDATTRMVERPRCLAVSAVAEAGFVVNSACYTPFNSQNTAFVRELLPTMVMMTPMGRYDDIWAAYLSERVMREFGLSVHFGRPLVWQERNAHNAIRDLEDEMHGLRDTLAFTRALDEADCVAPSIVDATARVYDHLATGPFRHTGIVRLGRAWLRDVATVLGA